MGFKPEVRSTNYLANWMLLEKVGNFKLSLIGLGAVEDVRSILQVAWTSLCQHKQASFEWVKYRSG